MICFSEGFLKEEMDFVLPSGKDLYYETCQFEEPYKLDVETILRYEEVGFYFSVKGQLEGRTVAYMGGLLHPLLHAKGVLAATSDVMFVDKSLGSRTDRIKILFKLIEEFKNLAKQKGAKYIQVGVSAKKDFSKLLEKQGYKKIDIMMMKEV